MKPIDYYTGREQTYLKHFFLERYLERVAYNIGYAQDEFVYVDGFSGPWRSSDENFDDTSFMIALQKLQNVREGLIKVGRSPRIRCLFIEKDPVAFRELERATQRIPNILAQALCGEFEQLIPDILRFIGKSFALIFIDPTGWTGFGLKQIAPILQHRPGEVIVNFMFDYINRFLDDPRDNIAASFDELFGGPGWDKAVEASPDRESAVVSFYRERMRDDGNFKYVASTRIRKPTIDRTYFYLIYATRHPKGLLEFRNVEKKFIDEQERVCLTAKQLERIERTGQAELFAAAEQPMNAPSFEGERAAQLSLGYDRLCNLIQTNSRIRYDEALPSILELPLVWESDVKSIIKEMQAKGIIRLEGLKGNERTPKLGQRHVLVRCRI